MQRSVALLRAINVGGHNVKMDDLRKLFESLGLANVETFIASGNVLFDSPEEDEEALRTRVESRLREALGYEVATFIRSASEMAEAATCEPFPAAEGASLYVAFLQAAPSEQAVQKLMALRSEVDDFEVRGREVYWQPRTRMSDSTFSGAVLEKTLRMPATLRNVTTVRKLAAKASGARSS